MTAIITFVVVLAGIGIAYLALRDRAARRRTPSSACAREIGPYARPSSLMHSTLMQRSICSSCAPSRAARNVLQPVLDPHVLDGAVRETAISAQWLGHARRARSRPVSCARMHCSWSSARRVSSPTMRLSREGLADARHSR